MHEKIKPSSIIENILAARKIFFHMLALRTAQWVFTEIQVIIARSKIVSPEA